MNKNNKKPNKPLWIFIGAIALIYLLNPTAGVLELIPDNLPIIGNLDEAGATVLLIQSYKEIWRK